MSWKDPTYPMGQRHAAPPDLTVIAKSKTVVEQMEVHNDVIALPKQNPLAARRHTTFVVFEGGQLQTPPRQTG